MSTGAGHLLWKTGIITLDCCCKGQEKEFLLGQCHGQEGFGTALQDVDPLHLLLLGPLTYQTQAFRKPNEPTSCPAPWLFLCSGNSSGLSAIDHRQEGGEEQIKLSAVTHCHKSMLVQQSRGSPGLCRVKEFA